MPSEHEPAFQSTIFLAGCPSQAHPDTAPVKIYRFASLWYRRLPSLLYRGFPNPQTSRKPDAPPASKPADSEVGDTAGWETGGTLVSERNLVGTFQVSVASASLRSSCQKSS